MHPKRIRGRPGIGVVLVVVAALSASPALAQDLFVRLYQTNPDYLEAYLDSRNLPSNALISVRFTVVLTLGDGRQVTRSLPFSEARQPPGLYRTWIPHGESGVVAARGTVFEFKYGAAGAKADEFDDDGEGGGSGRKGVSGAPPGGGDPKRLGEPPSALAHMAARFMKPAYRLDWCLHSGGDCGWAAADRYCRDRGHEMSNKLERENDLGRREPTFVVGDKRVCNHASCDGFSRILCSSKWYGAPSYRLHWCLNWGTGECGKPAADRFCQDRGYQQAGDFQKAWDVGGEGPTVLIGDGRTCTAADCDGFLFIDCR